MELPSTNLSSTLLKAQHHHYVLRQGVPQTSTASQSSKGDVTKAWAAVPRLDLAVPRQARYQILTDTGTTEATAQAEVGQRPPLWPLLSITDAEKVKGQGAESSHGV